MFHLRAGYRKTVLFVAALLLVVGVVFPMDAHAITASPAPLTAKITSNGERSSVFAYGSNVVVAWSSTNADACVVTPGNWSGIQGSQSLGQVAAKQTYKLVCTGKSGTATACTTFAVAPPTFAYLRNSLAAGSVTAARDKAAVQGISNQIMEAASKYDAGRVEDAKKLLDLMVSKLPKMVLQEKLAGDIATKYAMAVQALKASWSAPAVVPDQIPSDEVKLTPVVTDPAGTGANCGGGYPAKWCGIPQDSVIDSWGMYNRESVSYTAYKVHADFLAGQNSHDMPYWGGIGNANQWDENARNAGIPVDTTPVPGAIAISNAGAYGHAMYVEQVGTINGQPAVYVSQYSANLDGKYSESWQYVTGLVFIHF